MNWLSKLKSNKWVSGIIVGIIAVAAFSYFVDFDFKLSFKKHDKSIGEQLKQVANAVPSASANEIHTSCEGKPDPQEKFDCYDQNFQTFMKSYGARKTLELLQQLHDLGGYAKSNCHPLSHKVGNIALHQYGSVPNAVPEYIPTCHSGFYHGLLEEYLATAPSYEEGVYQVCGTTQTQTYFNWFQCMHGLGHGVMQFRNNELPQALKDCDILDPANQAREMCYAGAFMENITTDEKTGHPAKYIKKEDPIYPCNGKEIAEHYRSACYFLASSQILKINGYNMQNAFDLCATVEQKYRYLCFQSLGRDVSGSSLRNKDMVIQQCQLAKDSTNAADCFYGAVRDFINEKGEFEGGIDLCKVVPDQYRQRCFDAIFLDMTLYKKGADFLDICAKMPDPYRGQCTSKVVY
ncbi:MAG TPA: hypothetical protein VD998_01005 [Verrucomicrobiae bacterium]|nr:hypothetical protein [Verrucomicrobiae bacterium]